MGEKYKAAKAGKEAAKPDDQFEKMMAQLPKDAQKKLQDIKSKLDKFKESVLKKFGEYVVGIALLPPQKALNPEAMAAMGTQTQMQPPAQPPSMQVPAGEQQMQMQQKSMQASQIQLPQEQKDQINVLVLVDDSDSQRMTKEELRNKLNTVIQNIAGEIDKKIIPQSVLISELWQNCFDAKYELVQLISISAPIFDKGMLAAIKISEIHKNMVLKKFEKYIVSYVLAGSLIQGKATEKSDIDVFLVIDDTDVKRMTRAELKDKLRAIIIGMGIEAGEMTGIRNKINIQIYILTDFWDSIREANPIIFTFLRDGVPFYDRGIFMPWKQLLKLGKIKPSSEAIDIYMSTGDQMLNRAKFKIKEIGMEDTFWAILTPSQAALMLYGVPPPTPKETPQVMREIFVKKEGLLEEEFVKILEKNIQIRKDLEHGDKKELTGVEVDKLLKDSDRYLDRIEKLFRELERIKSEEKVVATYDRVVTMIRDVLKLEGIERVDDLEIVKIFEDKLISHGKIPAKFLRILNSIIKAKKDFDINKLTKAETEKVRRDAEGFTKFLVEYMQRKRGKELEKAKIRVKHGNKFGEVIMLDPDVFIIHDIDHEEKEISKAKLTPSGGISSPRRSTLDELEKALATSEIPPKAFIKEKIFEDLKNFFGKDVEILISY